MGLPFDGIDLSGVKNAIGDSFQFAEMKRVMDIVHGENIILEIVNDREPQRIMADKCVDHSRRHGMLVDLLIGAATRIEMNDRLRCRLTETMRQAFRQFEDIAPPVTAIATAWPQQARLAPPNGDAAAQGLRRLITAAADSVERTDVLKAMRNSAQQLEQHSRTVMPLLENETAPSAFFLATSQEHVDALEEAVETGTALLARLSEARPDAIEARWVAGLGNALGPYNSALAAKDFNAIRSARNVLQHFLDATAGRFDEDLLAYASALPFEQVAVALRDAAASAGLASAIGAITPAILRCRVALAHRQEVHARWIKAGDALDDMREMIPADNSNPDDTWLGPVNEQWTAARTVVRTLCLLDPDTALHQKERELADAVGDAIAAAVQRQPDATADLYAAMLDYLALAGERASATGAQLERELDKLAGLRATLQTLRAALP